MLDETGATNIKGISLSSPFCLSVTANIKSLNSSHLQTPPATFKVKPNFTVHEDDRFGWRGWRLLLSICELFVNCELWDCSDAWLRCDLLREREDLGGEDKQEQKS